LYLGIGSRRKKKISIPYWRKPKLFIANCTLLLWCPAPGNILKMMRMRRRKNNLCDLQYPSQVLHPKRVSASV
jgi:hypothetical protein